MKYLFLLLLIFSIDYSLSQTDPYGNYVPQEVNVEIELIDSSIIQVGEVYGKTNDHLYFELAKSDKKVYKLRLSRIKQTFYVGEIDEIQDNIGNALFKFSQQSQLGIGLSITGTALSVILPVIAPILLSNSIALVATSAVSLTGFIIWFDSYRHLKKQSKIMRAIEYP